MPNTGRTLVAVLVAAILAACSSPGVAPLAPQAVSVANNTHRPAEGSLVLRIQVPREHRTRHHGPRYISPATQAMTIAITGPAKLRKTVALTPSARGCASSLAGTHCTLTIPGLSPCPSKAHCYMATIATYDAVTGCPSACTIPVGAHELSRNQNVAFTIANGESNLLNVTLDGIPASVALLSLNGTSGNTVSGFTITACGSSGQLEVLGLDADNNIILGSGAPTPALKSNDTMHLTVSEPSRSSPNTFTLSRTNSSYANGIVRLTATVTPGIRSGGSPHSVQVNVTIGLCGVYVADTGNNVVKEMLAVGGSIPASPTINTLGSGFFLPEGVAVDAAGNVYVADTSNSAVKEMLAVGGSIPASPIIKTLGSGFQAPYGVAVDGAGDVYVADTGNNAVKEMLAVGGSIPSSPTINTLGSGFSEPEGVAVDGAGNVYVADAGQSGVREMLAVGGSIPASPTINMLGSGFSFPSGVAVDGAGNVYVADAGDNAVKEMLAVGGSIPALPTINTLGSGFNRPSGVAVDGAGNVYVADTFNSAVKEMLAVGGSIPPSPTINALGSGFAFPHGVAIR
jgi:sugar lactone lactonase YvrE